MAERTDTEIWLIRHGETEWSRSGAHTGRSDIELTELGRQQALWLRPHLDAKHVSVVLTSPRLRAQETCRLAGLSEKSKVDENLAEWDYGIYEGRTTTDIQQEIPGWSVWANGVQGGESLSSVATRARKVIRRAVTAGGTVALFSHAHILRILAACWIGLPPRSGQLFALNTASVSVLGYEREYRVIRLWNKTFGGEAI